MFLMVAMICGEEPVGDLGSVFVEGDVADMVLAVLYSPMSAVEVQDVGGVGLVGGEAGDAVHGLVALA
jgi:hypothetical protein